MNKPGGFRFKWVLPPGAAVKHKTLAMPGTVEWAINGVAKAMGLAKIGGNWIPRRQS